MGYKLNKEDAFDNYAFFGGMPLIISRPDDTAKMNYLKSLFSEVYFKDIPQEVIDAYAESGEPLDKAGGYAVQGSFGVNIERIEGHVDNVIGFPLEVIKGKLKTVVL